MMFEYKVAELGNATWTTGRIDSKAVEKLINQIANLGGSSWR